MASRSPVLRMLLVLAAVVLVSVGIVPVKAQSSPDATVVPDMLNMRHGPGDQYAVIAKLARGTALTLLARDDIPLNGIWVWARTADGTEGWVSSDYLEVRADLNLDALPVRPAPDDIGTPLQESATPAAPAEQEAPAAASFPEGTGIPAQAVANVNMRTGPGTSYRVITTLQADTALLAKGRDTAIEWVFVNANGLDGWVYYSYIHLLSGYLSSLPVVDTVVSATAASPSGPAAGSESAPASGAAVPPPVSGGVGLTGFGYGGHVDSFAYPNLMAYAGMTWAKRQIRFSPGAPGAVAAGAIDQAHANGFKILLGIVGSSPNDVLQPGYFQDYARFVGEVAALGPDAIEVWNEQNIDREWANGHIDPASYTQLLALAYNAIKGANSSVAVISGAPAPTGAEGAFGTAAVWNDDRYVRGMAAAGAARYMDCIGAHYNEGIVSPYQTSGDPRGNYYTRYFWGMVNTYSSAFGGARPICFTELGYLSPEGLGPLPGSFAWGSNTTVAQQAQWLADAVRLSRSSGRVKLVIIWNVDFTGYGADPMAGYALVRPGGSCPACDALARVR
jgi:uncharacterized protein YraI